MGQPVHFPVPIKSHPWGWVSYSVLTSRISPPSILPLRLSLSSLHTPNRQQTPASLEEVTMKRRGRHGDGKDPPPDMDSHTGLRGVAALWVAIFHLVLYSR